MTRLPPCGLHHRPARTHNRIVAPRVLLVGFDGQTIVVQLRLAVRMPLFPSAFQFVDKAPFPSLIRHGKALADG